MAPADYFANITLAEYAELAFGMDKHNQPKNDFHGGVFAGKGTKWERTSEADTAATARLVPVQPPKIFVRWCHSADKKEPVFPGLNLDWAEAAAGSWWSSDAMADMIVSRTQKRFGEDGDSGLVAREYSAVRYEWGSDMKRVVVCQLTRPIRALLGVGRPVLTQAPDEPTTKILGNRELQYVIVTQYPYKTFRAHEFMTKLFLGTSTEFTRWWIKNDFTGQRRSQLKAKVASR